MNFLRNRQWWFRLAIGLVWTPIAAEFFLRFLAPVPMLPRYVEAGSHGVRANMPDQKYRHQTPEYQVDLRTNSQGMRSDEEYSIVKPHGTKRIVVLGDSFSMGYGVNLEDTSLGLLETQLESTLDCEVDIINLSVSGFGPAEELIVLEEVGLKFAPDLVIQFYTSNDPVDDDRSGLFTLEGDQLIRDRDSYLPAVHIREFLFSFATYRWMAGESQLYNLTRDLAGSKTKQLLTTIRSLRRNPEPTVVADDEMDSNQSREALTLAILRRMQERSEAAGADFLILSIPLRKDRTTFSDPFPKAGDDLPVISPIERFDQSGGEMLYWERSHGHWTPLGCRLVSETLYHAISSEGLLGKPCR